MEEVLSSSGLSFERLMMVINNDPKKHERLSDAQIDILEQYADQYKNIYETISNDLFHAVSQLKGGVVGGKYASGTAEDLYIYIKQKVKEYNNINPDERQKFAADIRALTSIDISKQDDINQLEMVVENEGSSVIKDPSLRNYTNPSKTGGEFLTKGSNDYNLLRDILINE